MFQSRLLSILTIVFCIFDRSHSATPDQWRSRSIYQVFTDRFARTDGSTTAECSSPYFGYCGGTWKGIVSKLDYIQVRPISNSPAFSTLKSHERKGSKGLNPNRGWVLTPSGYLQSSLKSRTRAEDTTGILLRICMPRIKTLGREMI